MNCHAEKRVNPWRALRLWIYSLTVVSVPINVENISARGCPADPENCKWQAATDL
jgi:hypothetical protein